MRKGETCREAAERLSGMNRREAAHELYQIAQKDPKTGVLVTANLFSMLQPFEAAQLLLDMKHLY